MRSYFVSPAVRRDPIGYVMHQSRYTSNGMQRLLHSGLLERWQKQQQQQQQQQHLKSKQTNVSLSSGSQVHGGRPKKRQKNEVDCHETLCTAIELMNEFWRSMSAQERGDLYFRYEAPTYDDQPPELVFSTAYHHIACRYYAPFPEHTIAVWKPQYR